MKSENSKVILWEGKVTVKGKFLARGRYGVVTSDKIIIRKKKKENSKVIAEISKGDIVDIEYPKYGPVEALVTGYQGLKVKYRVGEKVKKIHFWARGGSLNKMPNDSDMKVLVSAVAKLAGGSEEDALKKTESFFNAYYLISITLGIVGWFMAGLIGALIMIGVSYVIWWIWRREDIDDVLKAILIVIAIVAGIGVSVIVSLVVRFFILGV